MEREYLTNGWLIDWAKRFCKTKEELEKERLDADKEASNVLSEKLASVEITEVPIVFDEREFSTPLAFATAMFVAANHYKDDEEVIVRYSKPEDKKKNVVYIRFEVLLKPKKDEK